MAQRISVVGNSGSGKSTLARALAERLGLEFLELDSVVHQAGWTELPDEELVQRVSQFMDRSSGWVVEGNYGVVRELVWERAEAVVWPDPGFVENMRSIVGRTLGRLFGRKVLWNGNRERWTNITSFDPQQSVIAWAWVRHPIIRERYSAAPHDPRWKHLHFVRLPSRRAAADWVRALPRVAR